MHSKAKFDNNRVQPSSRLFIGGLPDHIAEADLRGLFETVGQITNLFLKKPESASPFAFIEYSTLDEAQKAIQKLNGRKMDDKMICVKYSKPRPPREGRGVNFEQRGGGDRSSRESSYSKSRERNDGNRCNDRGGQKSQWNNPSDKNEGWHKGQQNRNADRLNRVGGGFGGTRQGTNCRDKQFGERKGEDRKGDDRKELGWKGREDDHQKGGWQKPRYREEKSYVNQQPPEQMDY